MSNVMSVSTHLLNKVHLPKFGQTEAPLPERLRPAPLDAARPAPAPITSAEFAASPVHRLDPIVQKQLAGLIERVFFPVSGKAAQSVGLVGIGPSAVSGPLTVALAEALALTKPGRGVCAIDANLVRPSLHQHFSISNATGLTSAVDRNVSLPGLATRVRPSLWVLPSGATGVRPALATRPTRARIAHLIGAFDYVFVDLEPAGEAANIGALTGLVSGVILVIDAQASRRQWCQNAVEALRASGVTIFPEAIDRRLREGRHRHVHDR